VLGDDGGGPVVGFHEHHRRRPAGHRLQPERTRSRVQVEHGGPGQFHPGGQQVEQRLPHPVGGGPGTAARRRDPAATERPGDDAGQLSTASRSPPSTWAVSETAMRLMVPALGAVIAASIFMASMVAMVWPASTRSPVLMLRVTTPANGAAMWSGLARSAFSAAGI